jgi:hypothetical protein
MLDEGLGVRGVRTKVRDPRSAQETIDKLDSAGRVDGHVRR